MERLTRTLGSAKDQAATAAWAAKDGITCAAGVAQSYASSAATHVSNAASTAKSYVTGGATAAADRLAPAVTVAKQGAHVVADRMAPVVTVVSDRVAPVVNGVAERLTPAARALKHQYDRCRNNPYCSLALDTTAGIGVGVTAVALTPVVLGAVGFGAGGVAGSSLAAAIQSKTGITAAFSVCQSIGAAGFSTATTVLVPAVGGLVGTASHYRHKSLESQEPGSPVMSAESSPSCSAV